MLGNSILIVYGSRHGQTAKVADRMGAALTLDGFPVTIVAADALPSDADVAGFAGVIVGASVIVGKHQASVERFVMTHLAALHRVPSAFFSVSGTACTRDARHQGLARRTMESFLAKTRWTPDSTMTVAGALAYTKYGPFTRWIIKQISRRAGATTDTSRDHEFTDWSRVEEFAHRFGRLLIPERFEAPDALGAP